MFLTEDQLHELTAIIQNHFSAFVANQVSPTAIPPETLARLKEMGLVNVRAATLADAYAYGILVGTMRNQPKDLTYADFKRTLKTNPVPLSPVEKQAQTIAQLSAGQYIQGIGTRMAQAVGAAVMQTDAESRRALQESVRTQTEMGIANRASLQQLTSALGHDSLDFTRDMRRVANTEVQEAMQQGTADNIIRESGPDALVARLAAPACCDACTRLFNEPDGKPRIFKLGELMANGNNVGRKQAEWVATSGVVHPNCRCTTVEIPDGWSFNADNQLVPPAPAPTLARSQTPAYVWPESILREPSTPVFFK